MKKFLVRGLALLNVIYFPIGITIVFIIFFILAVIESIRYKDICCIKEWFDGDCLKVVKISWKYVIEQLKTGEYMKHNEFYDEELKNSGG